MTSGRALICGLLVVSLDACTVISCPGSPQCSGPSGSSAGARGSSQPDGGAFVPPETTAPELPSGKWLNVTGSLAGMPSGCGNLATLVAKPDEDVLIAGVFLHGLYASTAGDTQWTKLGTGKGSAVITNSARSFVFDPDDPARFWESGIYGTGVGVYETRDNGRTFSALGDYSYADSVSLDFSDSDRQVLFAGAHEAARSVAKSSDGGATWSEVGQTLPSDRWCTVGMILNPRTYLLGCGLSGGLTGIFRSTDSGKHWKQVSEGGGSSRPLLASDGSLYWTTASNGQLLRSTDTGQTWVEVMPPHVLTAAPPIELPDGRLVALGPHTLVISSDQGQTWDYASSALPFTDGAGVLYSTFQRAFFIWHWDCNDVVLNDAVMRFDFDFETQ